MLRPAVPPLAALLFAACVPSSAIDPNLLTSAAPESSGEVEGSTTSGSSGEPLTTEIGETAGGTGTGEEATTGEPPPGELPAIAEAKWTPDPLTKPGSVTLDVRLKHGDGVLATYDGQPVDLVRSKDDPDRFTFEVLIDSELSDGTHTAVLRATGGILKGEAVEVSFVADLPAAGSEGGWEAGKGLGVGLGSKIVRGPNGELYEFGTLDPAQQQTCYVRRRLPDGMAPIGDVVKLQPGKLCTAIDVEVDPDGNLLLLYEVEDLGSTTWQLDRHDPWDKTLFPVLTGAPNTEGNAVALGEDGAIAVCGSQQGGPMDRDMVAWLGGVNNPIVLDLVYEGQQPNFVSETANDCLFVGSTLVFAGEADGQHLDDLMKMKRHTVVEYDMLSKQALWIVASGEGISLRSSAQAIARDDDAGYVTAGHVCGDPCFPQLELRSFAPGGVLTSSFRTADKTTIPSSVDWHPAGYAIVTAAELVNPMRTNFWVQGWIPGEMKDLWTYRRSDIDGIHWAFDAAIGQTGLIFTVGVADVGDAVVPVFAILFP